jgi:hypothetical protein
MFAAAEAELERTRHLPFPPRQERRVTTYLLHVRAYSEGAFFDVSKAAYHQSVALLAVCIWPSFYNVQAEQLAAPPGASARQMRRKAFGGSTTRKLRNGGFTRASTLPLRSVVSSQVFCYLHSGGRWTFATKAARLLSRRGSSQPCESGIVALLAGGYSAVYLALMARCADGGDLARSNCPARQQRRILVVLQ